MILKALNISVLPHAQTLPLSALPLLQITSKSAWMKNECSTNEKHLLKWHYCHLVLHLCYNSHWTEPLSMLQASTYTATHERERDREREMSSCGAPTTTLEPMLSRKLPFTGWFNDIWRESSGSILLKALLSWCFVYVYTSYTHLHTKCGLQGTSTVRLKVFLCNKVLLRKHKSHQCRVNNFFGN